MATNTASVPPTSRPVATETPITTNVRLIVCFRLGQRTLVNSICTSVRNVAGFNCVFCDIQVTYLVFRIQYLVYRISCEIKTTSLKPVVKSLYSSIGAKRGQGGNQSVSGSPVRCATVLYNVSLAISVSTRYA